MGKTGKKLLWQTERDRQIRFTQEQQWMFDRCRQHLACRTYAAILDAVLPLVPQMVHQR